jgi:hypothetical protein
MAFYSSKQGRLVIVCRGFVSSAFLAFAHRVKTDHPGENRSGMELDSLTNEADPRTLRGTVPAI